MSGFSKLNNYAVGIIIFLIFTFPYVPLFNIGTKVIQIETLLFFIIFLLCFYELYTLENKYWSWNKKILLFVIWGFTLSTIYSLFYTSEATVSQIQDLFYWTLSLSPLLFIKKRGHSNGKWNFAKITIFSSLIGATIVIFLKIGGENVLRSFGFISNANLAGSLFALAAILSFGIYLEEKKWSYLWIFLVNLIAIFATGSRESLISIVLSIIILGAILGIYYWKYLFKWAGTLLLIVTSSIIILQYFFEDILRRYFITFSNAVSGNEFERNLAFSDRLVLWEELLELIQDNPLLPYGFQGLSTIDAFGQYAHNMVLQSIVIGGLFGLVLFLIFWSVVLNYSLPTSFKNSNIMEMCIFSFFISYTLTGWVSDHFLNFFTLNYVFFTILKEKVENDHSFTIRNNRRVDSVQSTGKDI